jgi:ABC-2 type transport system permease protein
MISIVAVAIGFIVRSTAGGIAVVVALLLVLPGLGDILPPSWQTT